MKIKEIKELQEIKLPVGWEIARLDVLFVKTNVPYPVDQQFVKYDLLNNVFYLKTPREGSIYEDHANGVLEGIEVMRKANKIIKK